MENTSIIGNIGQEEIQWIADFCAQKFLQYENPIAIIREQFEREGYEKELPIALFQSKPEEHIHNKGVAIFLDTQKDAQGLTTFYVSVLGPQDEQQKRIMAESNAKEFGVSREQVQSLLEKYKIIAPGSKESLKEEIKIFVPTTYNHQAGSELLAILKSEAMQGVKSISVNYSEPFELPEKFGVFFPKEAMELKINEKVFLHDANGNAKITYTSQMPPSIPHLKSLSIGNIGFSEVPQSFAKDFPHLKSLELTRKENHESLKMDAVFKCKTIESLTIKGLNLKAIPEGVLSMAKLEYLDISNNHINQISDKMSYTNLKYLDMSKNQVENIDNLPYHSLNYLDVSQNKLEDIPKQLMAYLTAQMMVNGHNVDSAINLQENQIKLSENAKDLELVLGVENMKRLLPELESNIQVSQKKGVQLRI